MAYDYSNPEQKKDNKSVWDTLTTGLDKFLSLKTTQEQQKLEQIKLQQQAGELQSQQVAAGLAAAQQQSLTEQFMAKLKANKAILVPLAIAGSLAIVGVSFYYFKKSKK